jgi:hypothetical protein
MGWTREEPGFWFEPPMFAVGDAIPATEFGTASMGVIRAFTGRSPSSTRACAEHTEAEPIHRRTRRQATETLPSRLIGVVVKNRSK